MQVRPSRVAGWLLLCSAVVFGGTAVATPPDDWAARSRVLADQLVGELKAELGAALQSGGPVAAVEVCRTRAPVIAAQLSSASGAAVGRTALRVRNPANAPDDVSRALLQRFAAELAGAGTSPAASPPEAVLELRTARGVERRYLRAIPMQELCVTCHGNLVAPELQEAIRRNYPADEATGFEPGELRGAVVVRWPIED